MARQQGPLRILALSDQMCDVLYSPAIVSQFGDAEIVISCGDLPFPYLEYIVTMLHVPVLYVPGNHDRPTYTSDGRTVAYPEGAINIDGRAVTLRLPGRKPLTVVGFGGSIDYGGDEHQYTESAMRRRVMRVEPVLLWNKWVRKRHVDILVTHAPPRGIQDGTDRAHKGFNAFLTFMRRYRPRYHLHGHVHPSYGYDMTPTRYYDTEVRSIFRCERLEVDE
jgi:Icc-related predicted phosphoesterase